MKLYNYFRSSASYRVRIALALKGLDYDYVSVHLQKNEQFNESYAAVSAARLVPTLVDGTLSLTQSLAICEYLDETHPEPPLLPADALGRARVRTLCRVLDLYVAPESGALFRQLNPATRDPAAVETAKGKLATALPILDGLVGAAPHTGPAGISLADCALLPYVRLMRKTVVPAFGVADPLSLPNLAKWSECMAAHRVAGPFVAEYETAVDAFLKMLRGG